MRVLVVGGGGFIGPHIVRYLGEMGHEVAVFNRGRTSCDFPSSVAVLHGDHQELFSYRRLFGQFAPDVVLHMVAMNAQDARRLIRTFNRIAQRIVVVSSMDVYQAFGYHRNLEEDAPLGPYSEDSQMRTVLFPFRDEADEMSNDIDRIAQLRDYEKILVESVVLSQDYLPGTILRLPAVYGPNDPQHRLYEYLRRMDDGRPAILLDERKADWRLSRGYVEDIAWGIALAVDQDKSAGHVFNIAEESAWSEREWVQRVAAQTAWDGKIVSLPRDELPEHLQGGGRYERDLIGVTEKIRGRLGYKERLSSEVALLRTISWERSCPPESTEEDDFNYEAEDVVLEQYRS